MTDIERLLEPHALIPVNVETTALLKAEIDRLRAELELWKDRANRARALLADHHPAMEDAASQIDHLRAENAKLREDIAAHLNTILYLQMESIRAKTAKEEPKGGPADPDYDAMWEAIGKKCPTCHTTDPYEHEPGCVWLHETPWLAKTAKEGIKAGADRADPSECSTGQCDR